MSKCFNYIDTVVVDLYLICCEGRGSVGRSMREEAMFGREFPLAIRLKIVVSKLNGQKLEVYSP